jgi:hypothetical protein
VSNIILPANTLASGGLRVGNALNFMGATDNARFQRTNGSNGSSTQATLSAWIKYQTTNTSSVPLFMAPDSAGNDRFYINITSAQEMGGTFRDPDCDFSSTDDVKLRDPAAWYHIVAAINTSDSTAADRLKVYVNNERITLTFASGGGLGSGANIHFNTSGYKNIFGYNDVTNDGVQNLSDLYFAEVIKCDGQVLTPSSFAEYDDDGVWVPKTGLEDSLTFGTTGYYYNFADSSDLANDVSGNGNDASSVSNTTQSLDTPSNNFATWNPLFRKGTTTPAFTEGNLKSTFDDSGANEFALTTFGVDTGKWYAEVKWTSATGTGATATGILDMAYSGTADPNTSVTNAFGYFGSGQKNVSGTASSYGASYTSGDIIGIALNCDDNQVTFYKNGSSQGTISIISGVTYGIFASDYNNKVAELNTGNPQFSISSGNTDENGFGNFEYTVPSGYFSLCTKNLAEYG